MGSRSSRSAGGRRCSPTPTSRSSTCTRRGRRGPIRKPSRASSEASSRRSWPKHRKRSRSRTLKLRLTPEPSCCFTAGGANSAPERKAAVDPFDMPDLASLSDGELKQLIDDLMKEESEVSYRRRILHGKIDILRAERNARLKKTEGRSILEEVDVDRLTEILASKG